MENDIRNMYRNLKRYKKARRALVGLVVIAAVFFAAAIGRLACSCCSGCGLLCG